MARQATKTKASSTKARSGTARKTAKTAKPAAPRAKSATRKATARKTTAARKTAARKTAPKTAAVKSVAAKPAMAAGRATVAQNVSKPSQLPFTASAAMSKVVKEMVTSLAVEGTPDDAIALLKADHRKVEGLFEEFEHTQNKAEKAELAAKICLELRVHTQVEEEILYPPAHKEIEHDLVDEAVVEHAGAKDLIAQIEAGDPADHLYDAKMKVLKEYIKHHVKEEEEEMFPKLKGHDLNLHAMAEQMADRKAQLLKQFAKAK